MTELDNPADRIVGILERAQKRTNQKLSATEGWQSAFDATSKDALPEQIAHFIAQVRLMQELVVNLPDDEDPHHLSKYFDKLDQICASFLGLNGANMSQFAPLISEELLFSLHSCSRALRRKGRTEPTLDPKGIDSILGTIRQVQDELAESDLPQQTKILLVCRVRQVEDAVRAYRIAGYAGLESALGALVGSVAWRTDSTTRNTADKWVSRIWKSVHTSTKGAAEIAASTQAVVESYRTITGQ